MAKNNYKSQVESKIEFADEAPSEQESIETAQQDSIATEQAALPVMTEERNRLNQQAAVKMIESLKHMDIDRAFPMKRPVLTPITAAEEAKIKPEIFRVLEDRKVAANGGTFVMRTGKIISSNQYDVPALVHQGVKLEKLST